MLHNQLQAPTVAELVHVQTKSSVNLLATIIRPLRLIDVKGHGVQLTSSLGQSHFQMLLSNQALIENTKNVVEDRLWKELTPRPGLRKQLRDRQGIFLFSQLSVAVKTLL